MTAHPNIELTRRGYEAFAKGDVPGLSELMADEVTWHVSDGGPLSGTYHGRHHVLGFFARLAEEERQVMNAVIRIETSNPGSSTPSLAT